MLPKVIQQRTPMRLLPRPSTTVNTPLSRPIHGSGKSSDRSTLLKVCVFGFAPFYCGHAGDSRRRLLACLRKMADTGSNALHTLAGAIRFRGGANASSVQCPFPRASAYLGHSS